MPARVSCILIALQKNLMVHYRNISMLVMKTLIIIHNKVIVENCLLNIQGSLELSWKFTYGSHPRSPALMYKIPARETVAGVAVFRWLISNKRRIVGVRGMRSLLARVRILLSSITVFKDSIHMGSISPSRTIHFGPLWVRFDMSRMIVEKRPAAHWYYIKIMIGSSTQCKKKLTIFPFPGSRINNTEKFVICHSFGVKVNSSRSSTIDKMSVIKSAPNFTLTSPCATIDEDGMTNCKEFI